MLWNFDEEIKIRAVQLIKSQHELVSVIIKPQKDYLIWSQCVSRVNEWLNWKCQIHTTKSSLQPAKIKDWSDLTNSWKKCITVTQYFKVVVVIIMMMIIIIKCNTTFLRNITNCHNFTCFWSLLNDKRQNLEN